MCNGERKIMNEEKDKEPKFVETVGLVVPSEKVREFVTEELRKHPEKNCFIDGYKLASVIDHADCQTDLWEWLELSDKEISDQLRGMCGTVHDIERRLQYAVEDGCIYLGEDIERAELAIQCMKETCKIGEFKLFKKCLEVLKDILP